MIVDKPLIAQILKGSKTQHRIPTTDTATSGFKVQQSYAVQARHDKPASCRVIIQAVTREPLDAITDDSAHAEGFATVGKFFEHWHATHPKANVTGDVWALSFVLDRSDSVRLLHKRSERGYTNDPRMALPREPESVDDATLKWYTADAHERHRSEPGRREKALRDEAQNLSRRLRQGVRTLDPTDMEVAVRLQRIRDEIAGLEALRPAA